MLTSATGEETLTPNPNDCNSILKSRTRDIYPHGGYILMLMRGSPLKSGVTGYEFATHCTKGTGDNLPILPIGQENIIQNPGILPSSWATQLENGGDLH